jgi:hypothetical protein
MTPGKSIANPMGCMSIANAVAAPVSVNDNRARDLNL